MWNPNNLKAFLSHFNIKEVINDWDRIQKILIKEKLLKIYKNNNPKYQILKMNTFKVSNFLINNIKKNHDFLLKDYL